MQLLPEESPARVGQPWDLLIEVTSDVLTGVTASPWLAGVLVLLVIRVVVRAVRAVIPGGHPRDPKRRFSRSDRAAILARAGRRCEQYSWLFGRCRETEALEADHVHPHSRGGATAIENGQALCRRHNKGKSARVPWNWELARLAKRRDTYFPPDMARVVVRHRLRGDHPAGV